MTDPELVLALLGNRTLTGRELRARLNEGRWWWKRYGHAGFTRLMAKLHDAGRVERVLLADRYDRTDGEVFAFRRR